MDIQLEHPDLLHGLWLLPLLWLLTWRSRSLLTSRSKIICSAIRSTVLALTIVALSQPFRMTWQEQQVPTALGILVDRSRSVEDAAADADARRQEYESLRKVADRVVDLDFAATAWPSGTSTEANREGTDIGGALDRIRAEIAAAEQGAVLLVTDGRQTTGDALQAAARLRASGIHVHVVPIGRHKQAGPRIVSVEPPGQARIKEPVRIKVRLRSDYASKVEVRLLDSKGMEVDRRDVECGGDRMLVLRHVPHEPGLQNCTVLLANSSDVAGEQTMASVPYYVEGPPKILLVDTFPEEVGFLASALGTMDLVIDRRPAAGLSLGPEELNTYEAVVLSDVAGPDSDAATQANLLRYVEEQGGGLVFIGGRSVSAKRWHGSELEKLLPVELQPEEIQVIEQQQPVHVCFVLDKSGSMSATLGAGASGSVSKIQRVKDAVQASLKELPPTAIISVVVFDSDTRVTVNSLPVDQWASASDRVDRIVADGGTVMDTALETAIQLVKAKNVPGHIILLTDGMTNIASSLPPLVRWGNLVRDIRDAGISLTTVAVGAEADQALLEYLAVSAGGVSYFCDKADEIPKIFVRQAQTIRQVSRLDMSPFTPRSGPAVDLIRNIPIGSYPTLAASLASKERPLSQVVLITDRGKPLLAVWQYGLGKVAAFTSDAKGVWARSWVHWQDFGRFWSQVAGWVLRRSEKMHVKVESAVKGQDVRVLTYVTDTDGKPASGLRASGTATPLIAHGAPGVQLAWQEIRAGIYEGCGHLSRPGNHLCQIGLTSPGKVSLGRALILRPDDSSETAETGPDLSVLEAIANIGGGRVQPSVQEVGEVFRQSVIRRIPAPRTYWPWLVLAAILLWPIDVAVRRYQA
jgi:Ca-activated chloride channel family protein